MGDVIQLPSAGPFADHSWAREKADMLLDGIQFAVVELRRSGVDPEVLRPAAWNATKLAAWVHGRKWSYEMADALLRGEIP